MAFHWSCIETVLFQLLLSYSIHPKLGGIKQQPFGTSLAVQWLGLSTFTAVGRVQSLIRELRSHKPCGTANNNNYNYKRTILLGILILWVMNSETVQWGLLFSAPPRPGPQLVTKLRVRMLVAGVTPKRLLHSHG